LAAGHSVDGIINEDCRKLLTAIGRMNDLGSADRRQITITLIGENDRLGRNSFYPGGHGRGPAM
jgi:hypothetical protein